MYTRRGNPARFGRRGWSGSPPFNGNFASLFSGVLQSVQTDLGLTYGGTTLAGGGATDTVTLTGTLATNPVPILAKGTGTGVVSIYYDGGTTPAMTGVTPSAGVPVALTGAGLGLSLTWASATIAAANTWTATCAALADQSVNAVNYAQATAIKQPVVGVGLNGNASLIFNGSSSSFISSLNLPAPATTPYYVFGVFRQITWAANASLFCRHSGTGNILAQTGVSPAVTQNIGADVSNSGAAIGTWVIMEISRVNTVSDPMKIGSTTVTGNAGNATMTGIEIGTAAGGLNPGSLELLAFLAATSAPNWPAIRAAVTAKYGASVLL